MRKASSVTGRPYSMRDERHAEAGLSQMRRPAARESSRISCLVRPASSSGAATPCCRAACLSGTVVALIVRIHAVGDDVEAVFCAELLHHREELVFAMKAARGVVLAVFGVLHLGGRNHGERNFLFLREGYGVVHLRASQAGRVGKNRQHFVAEFAVRGPCQEGGIDTAGVSHQHASQRAQTAPAQSSDLAFRARRS